MTLSVTNVDFAPLLERCFLFEGVDTSYEISGVAGRVPEWLRGCYYVNGPARFECAGARYRHWLDGDGMVCSLRFGDQDVRFTSRFVQTRKFCEEKAEGRFIYRGFGTRFPGDRLHRNVMLEPPVNVSVYPFDGRLLAFGEQSLPYELDPVTLETRGQFDFHGALNEVSPFAAHAKFDGHMLNFGISFSAVNAALNLYEFSGSGQLLKRRRVAIGLPHSVHDFGITPNRAVFFLSPLLMNFKRFLSDGASVMESLTWEPERGSRILVIPRGGKPEESFLVPTGHGYCLHLINCFEDGNCLTVDLLELERPVYAEYQPVPDLFPDAPRGGPVRYMIDCPSRQVIERLAMPYDRGPDFPAVDPSRASLPYDDFWMLGIQSTGRHGRKFFDQLAHASWGRGDVFDVFNLPSGEYFGGEPMYVANPRDPGEAVVIVEHLQPARNEASFVLFDAYAVKNGPVARLPLRNMLHPGFHSSFWKAFRQS